ncbi:MAG: L,D-transpeptidase family protein [Methyloceanibacter sp.]|uniref:L,D-transpeptidase family protein n=1 Tax=Methyloceanibacter sp. TaxID=1965321 RepID=UPI003EDF1210
MRRIALALILAASVGTPGLAAEPDGPAELITKTEAVRIAIQDQLGVKSMGDVAEQIALAEYYSVPDRRLLWVDDSGITDRGKAVIGEIAKADDYGLRAADYRLPQIASFDPAAPDAVEQLADAELKISSAVVEYAQDARGGRIKPQSLSKNLDPKLFLPEPAEVISFIAIRSDPAAYLRSFQPNHPQFEALRKALLAERGGNQAESSETGVVVIPNGPLLKLGVEHGQVALLRKRLEVPVKAGGNEYLYDQQLLEAVREFQKSKGGHPDGIVGSGTRQMLNGQSAPQLSGQDKINLLLVNMERWRWLPQDLGAFYVDVNIPEFKLRVVGDDAVVWETRVVVGKTNKQTPVFNDEMEEIVFRPNWYVPTSIKSEEIAPYLYRGGGFFGGGWDTAILKRQGLRIRGANGRDIDPDTIDWSRSDIRRYEVYQPPGSNNVLGLVKFRFPNTHDVYLHDTTQKHLFANAVRANSHGCMRVQNPDQFATVLLGHDQGWDASRVNAAMHGNIDSNKILLKQHIPVYLTYFTARVEEDGKLAQFRDLYGHDRRMTAALSGGAVPYGLPGSEEVAETTQRPVARRRDANGDFNAITRALFDF